MMHSFAEAVALTLPALHDTTAHGVAIHFSAPGWFVVNGIPIAVPCATSAVDDRRHGLKRPGPSKRISRPLSSRVMNAALSPIAIHVAGSVEGDGPSSDWRIWHMRT